MELIIYPRLSRKGQKSMLRMYKRFGKPNFYEPQYRTAKRISEELGWSLEEVYKQFSKEQFFLRRNPQHPVPNVWYRGKSYSETGY